MIPSLEARGGPQLPRNIFASIVLVAAVAVGATLALADRGSTHAGILRFTPTPARTPIVRGTPTPAPTPIAPPRAEAATGLAVMATECRGTAGANSARAFFLWGPSRGGTQFVDLSIFNNGFAGGTFVGSPAIGRDGWGFVWDGLLQGTTHYARVNTLTSAGWKSSQVVAFYTPVCDANAYLAVEPAPRSDMIGLRDRIGGAIYASGLNAAAAVTDLQTGETININGNDVRLPGCTINLFNLMRVVVDLQAGRYPEPAPGDLIGQTINRSDPITSRRLMRDWVGGGNVYTGLTEVNQYMRALGMNATLMDHPPAYWEESLNGGIDNRITALDANRGLRAIWDGRALTPGWRDYFLQKMTLVKPGLNYLVSVGVGSGAHVSHKNGFLWSEGWSDNDIGIIWFERGGQRYGYAISFYSQFFRGKYDAIPLGQRISSMTYQWFVGRYGYP
jgi:beta-lactamase class A